MGVPAQRRRLVQHPRTAKPPPRPTKVRLQHKSKASLQSEEPLLRIYSISFEIRSIHSTQSRGNFDADWFCQTFPDLYRTQVSPCGNGDCHEMERSVPLQERYGPMEERDEVPGVRVRLPPGRKWGGKSLLEVFNSPSEIINQSGKKCTQCCKSSRSEKSTKLPSP